MSWYKERVYNVGNDYDPSNRESALKKVLETGDRMPTGILFQSAPRLTFASRFRKDVTDRPLAEMKPVSPDKIDEFLSNLR